jgi:putative membrane protein
MYIAFLPFQLVNLVGWATIIVVFIASFTLLGVLAIAREIEEPFGYDHNDLNLDEFCQSLKCKSFIIF